MFVYTQREDQTGDVSLRSFPDRLSLNIRAAPRKYQLDVEIVKK